MGDHKTRIKNEVVDLELEISHNNVLLDGLCSVCLCMSGDAHTPDAGMMKHYMDIVRETHLTCLASPRLCWVCSTQLQRVHRFREQVKHSHGILQAVLEASDREDISELVRRVSRPPRLQMSDCSSIDIPGCAETADEDDEYMEDPIYVETEYLDSDLETDFATDRNNTQNKTKDNEQPDQPSEPIHHDDSFQCSVCQKAFSRNDSLRRHMTTHTGEAKSTKRECKVCMKRVTHMKRHLRTHTHGAAARSDQKMPQQTTKVSEETIKELPESQPLEEKPSSYKLSFKCDSCDYFTVSKQALERHLKLHDENRPFQCKVCEKNFTRNDALKRHMATHLGANELFDEKRQCKVCKKRFSRRSYLKSHMRTHTGERPYACLLCQTTCSTSAILKIHMRVHTGERPYKCTVCEKNYSNTSDLRRHMASHGADKPFKCTLCEKAYLSSCSLKEHMITHAEKRPFECAVCNKGFSRSCLLNAHMKSHAGEKPYKCVICPKGFTRRGNVVKHIEEAHPEYDYDDDN